MGEFLAYRNTSTTNAHKHVHEHTLSVHKESITARPEEGSIKSAKYPAAFNLEQISLALSINCKRETTESKISMETGHACTSAYIRVFSLQHGRQWTGHSHPPPRTEGP